jgi:hypothetical protein
MKPPLKLWYREPAPTGNEAFSYFKWGHDVPDDGWEKWSLPIGNGNMGVNVFGRTTTERLQFSEKSLSNSYHVGGQNNFTELYLDFNHEAVSAYERSLVLDEAVASVSYEHAGVRYGRECFASYPDNVFAMRLTSSRPGGLSFAFRPTIPYLGSRDGRLIKTGKVAVADDTVALSGELVEFAVLFAGLFRVIPTGGTIEPREDRILVKGADSVVLLAAIGTNYHLESRVFLEREPRRKLSPFPDPMPQVRTVLDRAAARGYDALRKAHVEDHGRLFRRVEVQLGNPLPLEIPTDALLRAYQSGEGGGALESLFFQYGRYLLIASSRPGTLPAHLQGAWNRYDHAPWSAGYWHNINVQMNYWPAFPANLCETFEAYAAYFRAYLPLAERHADSYIQSCHPERYEEGRNGWIIGTGAWPCDIQGLTARNHELEGHSGPGTGGLTSLLFWEYYRFTGDRELLRTLVYPALASMSRFLSKVVEERDGVYLTRYSASPEQRASKDSGYYHTTGCAFDQQMIRENHLATLEAAGILGLEDDLLPVLRQQVDHLDPVLVGTSGQVKEYREEQAYGEIGEPDHRHVSHLVSLYPGCQINSSTPEWLEAAKTTLALRGDKSTGWGMAHRMLLWARAKEGERAYRLFRMLLEKTTYPNLWAAHPPFQIDANFGGTAGVAEMLLQSHEGYIELLPAMPAAWSTGRFRGLLARGGFEIDAEWRDRRIVSVRVRARNGGLCRLKWRGVVRPVADAEVSLTFDPASSLLAFEARKDEAVVVRDAAGMNDEPPLTLPEHP